MPKKPPSKNIARLNEDMKRELISIIGAMKDPRLAGGLLTVTRVEVTRELSQCKVYVSVLPGPGGAAEPQGGQAAAIMAALTSARGHVRSEVAARMHIRRAPEMIFVQDTSAAYAAHINEILTKLP